MTWNALASPELRSSPGRHVPFVWPTAAVRPLCEPLGLPQTKFGQVVMRRRTRRTFSRLSEQSFSDFLWMSYRIQARAESNYGFYLSQRPVPGAGAIHSIHLIFDFPGNCHWWRYDPEIHGLAPVALRNQSLREAVESCVPTGDGVIILLASEIGKLAAKYKNPESLVWRDSGALLGHSALVAEALSLNYCPLGITGDQWVSGLGTERQLIGVGLALLGGRT